MAKSLFDMSIFGKMGAYERADFERLFCRYFNELYKIYEIISMEA